MNVPLEPSSVHFPARKVHACCGSGRQKLGGGEANGDTISAIEGACEGLLRETRTNFSPHPLTLARIRVGEMDTFESQWHEECWTVRFRQGLAEQCSVVLMKDEGAANRVGLYEAVGSAAAWLIVRSGSWR